MDQIVELFKQIQELAGVGVEVLQRALKGGENPTAGGPPEGGEGAPPEAPEGGENPPPEEKQ